MRGFFRSLQRLLKFGIGLFALVLLGELAQVMARWIGVPPFVLLILVAILAVILTALYVAFRRE